MACRLDGAKPLPEQMLWYVNWTLRNKIQWNFNRNSYIFIQENALENVVCEVASILSRPQCVNVSLHGELNERYGMTWNHRWCTYRFIDNPHPNIFHPDNPHSDNPYQRHYPPGYDPPSQYQGDTKNNWIGAPQGWSFSRVTWWRQDTEHFPRYWPFVRGNHRWHHKGTVTRSSDIFS